MMGRQGGWMAVILYAWVGVSVVEAHTYMYACMQVRVCTYTYLCAHACMNGCVHICMCVSQ